MQGHDVFIMSKTANPTPAGPARGSTARFALVTAITVARGPFILAFMACAVIALYRPSAGLKWTALAFMALSAVTDMFDGYLARKWNVTSRFGALCDPLMDKIFYAVVFPTLAAILFLKPAPVAVPPGGDGLAGAPDPRLADPEFAHAVLVLVLTVLYLLRDQWVSFLRAIAAGKADMRATWSGKLRTAVSFPVGCLLYAYVAFGWSWLSRPLMEGLEISGIAINLISIVSYARVYGFALKAEFGRPHA